MARFQKTRVGDAEIVNIQDTWVKMPPAAFFPEIPAAAWDAYREFTDSEGNLTLNLGAWAVLSQGRVVLVDTGLGGRPTQMPLPEPPTMPGTLRAAGISPADVNVVVYSHLHFDHTGWNTVDEGGKPVLLFPNARHVIQRREWEFWTSTAENRTAANFDNVLGPVQEAGLLDLVDGEYAVTSEMVTVPTPGHTPGHVSFVIASGGQRAYIIGDAAHQPVQVSETSWGPSADTDSTMSAASREALFERIEREGALVASGHFPFPGLGHAIRVDGKRRFRPLS